MSRSFLIIAFIVIGALGGWVSPVGAYREYFTPEQKAQLDKIQVVLIELLALTDKDRKSTRLNSSHSQQSRMPSSA